MSSRCEALLRNKTQCTQMITLNDINVNADTLLCSKHKKSKKFIPAEQRSSALRLQQHTEEKMQEEDSHEHEQDEHSHEHEQDEHSHEQDSPEDFFNQFGNCDMSQTEVYKKLLECPKMSDFTMCVSESLVQMQHAIVQLHADNNELKRRLDDSEI